MPLITTAPDALPYLDAPVCAQQLAAADGLIQAELAAAPATTALHPRVPAAREGRFPALVAAEHARIAAARPQHGGLDVSRYELPEAPARADLAAWRRALDQACASAEYLRGREVNLGLLEAYGANAWLIGNAGLEATLKALERELEVARIEQEHVEQTRRHLQARAAAEMAGLEQGWRTGVGRMIETQAAAERLRQEVLQRKRARCGAREA